MSGAWPIGPKPAKQNPSDSIPNLQERALLAATKYPKLMAEGDVLQDERTTGSKCGDK
jgi:hypothetical protein